MMVNVPGPDIDLGRIRPYGQPASRSGAFEELASILIRDGVVEWPLGTHFFRFGNPDGGREGKGVLLNGAVWAWQAKYLFEFDASAAGQVSSSIKRVLENEPNLKRYYVALPLDLPSGDTDTRTSAYTRWTEKVAEWKELAHQTGLDVDFRFVGAHDLMTALTEPRHEGRARYWFATDVLTPEWQSRRVDEAIAKAGRRYTPRLHVEVETVRALDAVGRVDAYVERWRGALAELRAARRWGWHPPNGAGAVFEHELPRATAALDAADASLESVIAAARSTGTLPLIDDTLNEAVAAVQAVDDLLHEHCVTNDRYFVGDAASLYSKVRNALGAMWEAEQLARSPLTRAASVKRLVVTGRAGVGKTHLLCDVAVRRLSEGRPTLLLLGQDFDGRSLLSQIGELTQLGGPAETVIALFDAAAQAAGCIGLLMIDALNESERAERWRDDLRALLAIVDRYPHVAMVLSCRTEFVDTVLGDEDLPTVEHMGFAEATDLAVRRFTQDFGLEPPTFPVLNPEFSNPLFLKLTCEALATLGVARFPFGTAGLVTVCRAFLEAVNKRLSQSGRSDYDERSDPVGRAVHDLALHGRGVFDRDDVQRITDAALPDRPWSRSLMRGLITEGVLIELSDGRIAFGYQRLGDVVRATDIASKGPDAVREWLDQLGDDRWRERGMLGALAVIVPERHGVELLELAAEAEGPVSYDVVDGFLESVLLRAPGDITERSVGVVHRLLEAQYRVTDIWDRLLRIACLPRHPLNAQWLHTHLAAQDLPERDASWSTWLVGSVDVDEESTVRRLIEWAWPIDLKSRDPIPDDVAALATQALGWLLTTTDRRVRDRATKAIVSIADRAPVGFAQGLAAFGGTNDPYVVERLAAAACGAVLRVDDPAAVRTIGDGVRTLLADGWPEHLLTRDFARRVYEVARSHGWTGPAVGPPYGARWPVPTRPIEDIEALAGPPDYTYGSIWHSLTGIGDFGHYVVQPALRDVVSEDEQTLRRDAERAIFDRVLELGWTPERFGEIDGGRSGGRDGVVERVGKKYQWIAFYEVLGRIADNVPVKRWWGDDAPRPYEYAEQLVWRDIDPTVLVRRPTRSSHGRLWFAPTAAVFPDIITDEYPTDMAGVPDPLDVLAVTDTDGARWLVLLANHNWKQPLPPEVVALEPPRLDVWMQLHAYLVPTDQADALTAWAQDKDWFGRWMPDVAEAHNVLLGSHPDDPEWEAARGTIDWWEARANGPQPADLLQSAAWYGGTGTSRDASAEEETRGYVPTQPLLDALKLSKGRDFTWYDSSGLAVHDPSVVLGGPGALVMRRDLVQRLHAAGMTIFWTVLAGHELHRRDHLPPGDDYRRVSASASYILDDDRIERIHGLATRCRPGPTTDYQIEWVTRSADP
jgi:sulfur relay (sulfurtransferase) DsrF/TusC family protein